MLGIGISGGVLHALRPLNGDPVCGRTSIRDMHRIASDVASSWAFRFIGSEDFGSNPDGSNKGPALHCVDCVVALAELLEGSDNA